MIHVSSRGARRISRLTVVGDPGFFSFIGNVARGLLGLPPSSGASTSGPSPQPSTALTVPPSVRGPFGLSIPTRGTDIVATAARGIFPGTTQLFSQGRALMGKMGRGAAAGGRRRRRRMNPGNFRALGRALRRLHSFERRARRVIRITHPHVRGRVTFRHKRRRRAA